MSAKKKKKKKKQYAARFPHLITDGIRLQQAISSRTPWWAKSWLALFDSPTIGARFGRGKSYAQSGQVKGLTITQGHATAWVQGANQAPYAITLTAPPMSAASRLAIERTLLDSPQLLSRIFVHDLPFEVVGVFQSYGLKLIPADRHDLEIHCTCQDWVRPCKHIIALAFILTELFANDPAQLLILMGLSPALFATDQPDQITAPAAPIATVDHDGYAQNDYWGLLTPTPPLPELPKESTGASIIHRLGPMPFWRGSEPFVPLFDKAYQRAQAKAIELVKSGFVDLRSVADKAYIPPKNLHITGNKIASTY